MFEHGFVDEKTLGTAQQNIRDAAAALRAHPRVDPDRFGMWFFSAGGLFMGSVLADPPAWGVAAVSGTYAAVAHPDVHDPALPTATVTAELSDIPLLLVMPEYDFEWIVTARLNTSMQASSSAGALPASADTRSQEKLADDGNRSPGSASGRPGRAQHPALGRLGDRHVVYSGDRAPGAIERAELR